MRLFCSKLCYFRFKYDIFLIGRIPIKNIDVERTYADISKANKLIGYNPKTSFEEGIKKFFNWYKQNIDLFK